MPQKSKERLDLLLLKRGLFASQAKAQAAIMAGLVLVEGEKITKAGTFISSDCQIRTLGEFSSYVSRGGLKLESALREFKVDVKGKVAIDIGVSTGGFTDCLLQHGVSKVYAVDVGYGQLAWKLRNDLRVVVIERTNARYLRPQDLYNQKKEKAQLVTIDVSFISLSHILPVAKELLAEKGEVIALVKPQFEAERKQVEKGGIVKNQKVHQEVLEKITHLAKEIGFETKGIISSPITGADGNVEYFIHLEII